MESARETPPLFAVGLLAGLAIGYELLLLRLFSIVWYHHFAALAISLALLGYGASGTFLALARQRLLPRFSQVFVLCSLLFAVCLVFSFVLAQRLPFRLEELFWDLRHAGRLLALSLLLALPFFWAATGIGLALARFPKGIGRLYGADLMGASVGSLGIVLLLLCLPPMAALLGLAFLAALATAVACWEVRFFTKGAFLLPLGAACVLLSLPESLTRLVPGEYKDLSRQLAVSGSRLLAERSGPLGQLSLVESPEVPFRVAPGLSLLSPVGPPAQLGLFVDGDGPAPIPILDPDPAVGLLYLDQLPTALPYHLRPLQKIVVLGASTGIDLLQARFFRVAEIEAVERNAQLLELVRSHGPVDYLGPSPGGEIHIFVGEAREFAGHARPGRDLVVLPQAGAPGGGGLQAMREDYLFTVEGFAAGLRLLAPEGWLAVPCWLQVVPRELFKIVATARAALESLGVREPGRHLLVIRSLQTALVLVKQSPVTVEETEKMLLFCGERGFEPLFGPGQAALAADEPGIFGEPFVAAGCRKLLGPEADSFRQRYKFYIEPATDDRPYFSRFFKWQTLPELLAARGRGGMALVDTGFLLVVVALLQVLFASGVLVVLPLWLLRPRGAATGPDAPWRPARVFFYFGAIGLGFLFLEIAFIQRLILLLQHPLYAAALVLAAFLFWAGLGARLSGRSRRPAAGIRIAVAAIIVYSLLLLVSGRHLFAFLFPLPLPLRAATVFVGLAPLALPMGMPFPLALGELGRRVPHLVPWAWAVNGCASVAAALLASLVAVHGGFTMVIGVAAVLYGLAGWVAPAGKGGLDGDILAPVC